MRQQRGQALVELALVMVVLAILLLGIIEVVTMYNTKSYITDADRAGVRLASLAYDDLSIANSVWTVLHDHGLDVPVDHGAASIPRYTCDVQKLEVYKAKSDGSLDTSTPNNEDVLYTTLYKDPVSGTTWCEFLIQTLAIQYPNSYTAHDTQDYFGFPQAVRHSTLTMPGAAPALLGVRVTYTYHYRTPLFSRLAPTLTIVPNVVEALGGDNANDVLNLPTSTPVNTFTSTPTPTNTPTVTNTPTITATPTQTGTPTNTATATSTGTQTNTPTITPSPTHCACAPTATPTYTATPTRTGTPTITPTPTATSTITSTPTVTPSPTQTPIPAPTVTEHLLCLGGVEEEDGIQVGFTGVPGATSYNIYYYNGTGLQSEGSVTPSSPGQGGTFPATPPFYLNVQAGTYFVVKAVIGGVEGAPGNATPVFTSSCSVPTS